MLYMPYRLCYFAIVIDFKTICPDMCSYNKDKTLFFLWMVFSVKIENNMFGDTMQRRYA